jgi:hypothetical protein
MAEGWLRIVYASYVHNGVVRAALTAARKCSVHVSKCKRYLYADGGGLEAASSSSSCPCV